MEKRKKIDFIGIGAQKAGTTWLYHSLNKIPGIDLPYVKELGYFSRSSAYGHGFLEHTYSLRRMIKPIRTYRMLKHLLSLKNAEEFYWYINWYFSNYNNQWYLSLFDKFQGIKGEITPNYSILDDKDIKKMHELLPEVKIIFLIRNPIDRCISHYYDVRSRKDGDFYNKAFDADDFNQFVHSNEQEIRSDYLRTLSKYRKVFSDDQILICFFDAIKENPEALLMDVFRFLGHEPQASISDLILKKKINPSKKPQVPEVALNMLKDKYGGFIKSLHEEFGSYCTKWHNDLLGEDTNKETLSPTMNFCKHE